MTSAGDDTSVAVALRIRPQSAAERIEMCRICTTVTPGHPQVVLGKDKAFTFDYVFDRETKQPEIYDSCIRNLVEGCLEGYNATVLAYGQTGSGKTYTMGTGFDVTVGTEEEGMLPRAVAHLFAGIEKRKMEAKEKNEPQPDFKITVQFMELYNEDLIDLFDMDNRGRKGNVKIHEDSNGIIYTVGITMKPVSSNQDTLNCLQQGVLSRTTASTNMNAQSSRSHAIFTIHLRQQRVVRLNSDTENSSNNINDYEYESLTAKFNFVDLAGSERLKRTGATGDRAKEGISINCGLLALGNVISALGDLTKKGSHVPYRDSKLTRLLQDSLGGNSQTLMIACVSPSDRDFMETLNTLKYANRARNIKNKVVVNQDKASKQISSLRAEIQKLTLELMEFRQGKRKSGIEGEQASDISHENSMLKSENDKMRVRIKALQQTIETQCNRITDLMAAQAAAQINGEVDTGVEELIQKYLKEIEDLRNKLTETEAIAMAITRRAMLKSRMNTQGASLNSGNSSSLLEMAKMDLAKQKQKAQKLESINSPKDLLDQIWQGEDGEQLSDESSSDEDNEEESETAEEGEGAGDEDSDEDESDDKDENEKEEALRGDLADLTTEIAIKEKLIEELELSQKKIQVLKTQYEQKLTLLHNKIRETEDERDHVLQNMKQQNAQSDKIKEIKTSYEKKINSLESEVKKMQAAKKEHQRLMRQKAQNEQQLRVMTNELSEMKKTKVRLMKQMKEEASKNKQQEARRTKEIAQLKKESRQRELAIRNLKTEKRQREAVLKRKQEEIKALRRDRKPISGQLGTIRNQGNISSYPVNGISNDIPNETSIPSITSSIPNPFPSSRLRVSGSKIPNARSPRKTKDQLSRAAKKMWDTTEKKISSLVIKKQTIANLEADMDRWIQDRDRLSHQLEKCQRKNEEAIKNGDENLMKESSEQLEALTAHMDYVQENIADSQANIMEMEEEGVDSSEIGELLTTASLGEARILLEHFLTKTMEMSTEAYRKDAAVKEMEAKLNAMKQHNELQQELLQHVLQQHDPLFSSAENLTQICAQSDDSENSIAYQVAERLCSSMSKLDSLGKEDGQPSSSDADTSKCSTEEETETKSKSKDKARRRTGLQEDFLYPDQSKRKRDSFFPKLEVPEGAVEPALPLQGAVPEPKPPKQISPELMQKLLELEKSRKLQDTALMPPPLALPDSNKNDATKNDRPSIQNRSQSMNNVIVNNNAQLPVSMVRGNIRSKSARSFQNSKYGNNSQTQLIKPRSQPSSPTSQRKNNDKNNTCFIGGEDGGGMQKEDVFARLTSSMPQDPDPDVGRMLPLRPPVGKPAALVCTYAATGHNSAVLDLDVTDDTMFTASKDRTVKVWDLNTGEEILSLGGHKRDVVAVKYCCQTHQVFSVSQNIVKIWDIRCDPCKCIKTLLPPGSSAIGSFISSMSQDSQINDLKVNSAGTLLYTALGSTVRVWDLNTYSMTGKLSGHTATVMTILLSERQNQTLLFTGSKDHYIKAYELDETTLRIQPAKYKLEPPHYDGVQSLALLGNTLFSGSRDNSIKKWDLVTKQIEQHITGAHKDWVCSLDFLPSRNVLLSGCRGGLLKLWQIDRCLPICEIKAHKHPIHAVATNSMCVFTASSDRLVRLWRPTGTLDDQIRETERAVQV